MEYKVHNLIIMSVFRIMYSGATSSNVKGTVLDSNNEPLIGATIQKKGEPMVL